MLMSAENDTANSRIDSPAASFANEVLPARLQVQSRPSYQQSTTNSCTGVDFFGPDARQSVFCRQEKAI
jgi:hypothetical protein